MNIVDLVVIGIIGLCVLFGLYRGFIQSVLNLGAGLLSVVSSFWLFPKLADVLSANTAFTRFVSTYTDSATILRDLGLSSQKVDALSQQSIAAIVERADLPAPLGTILEHNLQQKVFSPLGDLATTAGDYVNQTILSVSINVLCFVLCFIASFIVMTLLVNMIRAVFRYPVLKHFDALIGGAFGFLLGMVICYVAFTVLPLVESVAPLPQLRAMVDESALAQVFQNGGFVISIMNRKL